MKFANPVLVVTDIDKSVDFYKNVLGPEVENDFGANNAEMYFEEEDSDSFAKKRHTRRGICSPRKGTFPGGQRVVRFYDPDRHIIEVGESIKTVCIRFAQGVMTPQEFAARMDVPPEFVESCLE